MKNLTLLLLTIILTITMAPAASAATQAEALLHINSLSLTYKDTELVYRTVLHNTGNMTLKGITTLQLDFYDRNGTLFEGASYQDDANLEKLVLKPGESKLWTFTVKTISSADISTYKVKSSATFKSVKPAVTSGTIVKINNQNGAVSAQPMISEGELYISLKDMALITGASLRTNSKVNTVTLTYQGVTRTVNLGTDAKLINGNTMINIDSIDKLYPNVGVASKKTGNMIVVSVRIS